MLQYNRIKTKTPISLEILESAKEMMNQLRSNKTALPDCPNDSLIISIGTPRYLAVVAQECLKVYEVTGEFKRNTLAKSFKELLKRRRAD